MVRALRAVFSAACEEYSTVNCLDAAESDRYVELGQKLLSRLPIIVNVVVSDDLLVELEEMDFIQRHDCLGVILLNQEILIC